MFEVIGVVGIAISVLAYLPQVVHLAREHCSAGVSGRAWAMWLTSSVLVGALAVHRHDPVFVLLQLSTLASALIILLLVHRYRGMVCAAHALACEATTARRVDAEPTKGGTPSASSSLGTGCGDGLEVSQGRSGGVEEVTTRAAETA
jgi:uncharacterized protein with PQ loop repeat